MDQEDLKVIQGDLISIIVIVNGERRYRTMFNAEEDMIIELRAAKKQQD